MNYIRKLVSGKRRRFQDGQYDLDITYITPRVLAMSFPASGYVETAYRNPIANVVRFIKERHESNYWIFNCSERAYDKTKFDGQVSDFLWKDHHAPQIQLLFAMVKEMYEFLKKDEENVVVVHCNSGKGRTGTAIASLLLFSGFVDNMDDALKYYGWKRFSSGIGVSQPCQLRMIYYFEGVFKKVVVAPTVKRLKAIAFKTVPRIGTEGCKPFLEITNTVDDDMLWTNKFDQNLRFYNADLEQAMLMDFEEGKEPILYGDVQFNFKHRGVLSDSQFCRIAFNTAFIPPNNMLLFTKTTVSPDGVKKDSRFDDQFMIQLIFEDYCSQCSTPWNMGLDQFCENCKKLLQADLLYWKSIHQIIQKHDYPNAESGNQLHQVNELDKTTMLGMNLLFDSKNYIIVKPSKDLAKLQSLERKYSKEEVKQHHMDLFSGFDSFTPNHRISAAIPHTQTNEMLNGKNEDSKTEGAYGKKPQSDDRGSNENDDINIAAPDRWDAL